MPMRLIRSHPERVAHVHAKDVRSAVVRARPGRGGELPRRRAGRHVHRARRRRSRLRRGRCAALADIGYRGWIVESRPSRTPRGPTRVSTAGSGSRPCKTAAAAAGLCLRRRPRSSHDHLRVRPRPPGRQGGLVTDVTPASAGWRYVGFQVRRLPRAPALDARLRRPGGLHRRPGRHGRYRGGRRELSSASAAALASSTTRAPGAVYAPAGVRASASQATTDAEIAHLHGARLPAPAQPG